MNAISAAPKKRFGKPTGKYRRITDSSRPKGGSANDHSLEVEEFKFTQLSQVLDRLLPDQLMQTMDLQAYYRQFRLHPDDIPYFAFEWEGQIWLDCRLPFGSSNAPYWAERVSKAITRRLQDLGLNCFSYLDDWIVISDATRGDADTRTWRRTMEDLGFPEAREKWQPPSKQVTWLGVRIDSELMTASIPQERLTYTRELIEATLKRPAIYRRKLESLVGALSYVCRLVPAGKPHLFWLYRLMQQKRARVILPSVAIEDLATLKSLLAKFNGTADLLHQRQPVPYECYTDASSAGFGAYWNGESLSGSWQEWGFQPSHIATGELIAILAAVVRWGQRWQHSRVTMRIDSVSALGSLSRGWLRGLRAGPQATRVTRAILVLAAFLHISLEPFWIASGENGLADALSRRQHRRVEAQLRNRVEASLPLQLAPQRLPELDPTLPERLQKQLTSLFACMRQGKLTADTIQQL